MAYRPYPTGRLPIAGLFLFAVALLTAHLTPLFTGVSAAEISFRPVALPFTDPEIVAPLRGLHQWRGVMIAPVNSRDSYERYEWRTLEPMPGVYDFTVIDADLTLARATGKRHAFRIRTMMAGAGLAVPDYLVDLMPLGWWGDSNGDTITDTYIPDWNDPDFLDRFDALLAALALRYANHPDLAYLDIGGYGNWGEWHMTPFAPPYPSGAQLAEQSSLQRIIDAHLNAFNPDNPTGPRLVMLTENSAALFYALSRSPRIGWRRDSLGSTIFRNTESFNQTWNDPARRKLISERWKTAPIVAEFIGPSKQQAPDVYQMALEQARDYHLSLISNGNTLPWEQLDQVSRQLLLDLGKQAGYRFELDELHLSGDLVSGGTMLITARWENNGNAPAYEPWVAYLQLRRDGQVRLELPLYVDFETLLPTEGVPITVQNTAVLPADLSGGDYDLHLEIRDSRGYDHGPLPLAIEGRQADGSYYLGRINIVGLPPGPTAPATPTPTRSCRTDLLYGDGSGQWGQSIVQVAEPGAQFTLVERSSDMARGMVQTEQGVKIYLPAPGASFVVPAAGTYTLMFYSVGANTASEWVRLQICEPPDPPVTATPTFTAWPAPPVATRTATPTPGTCLVARYYGDNSGAWGWYDKVFYSTGTSFTLLRRSVDAARGIYKLDGQNASYLSNINDSIVLTESAIYHLGFEGSQVNTPANWVEIEICPPALTAPTATATSTPTATATPTPTATATSTPTATAAPCCGMVVNGDFELDLDSDSQPDGWSSNSRFTTSNSSVRSGALSGRHQASDNQGYTVLQSISGIVPDQGYAFEGWVNIPPTSDSFTLKFDLRWLNAAGGQISVTTLKSYRAQTAGWVQATANKVAPAGAAQVELRMVVSSLNATIYVDDLRFVSSSLLTNGAFEWDVNNDGRPDTWSSNARFTRTAAEVYDGTFAGRHYATDNKNHTISQKMSGLSGGAAYRFAGQVFIPATGDSFTMVLELQWRNASNTLLSTQEIGRFTGATADWTPVTADLTAPAGATSATIRMVITSLNATIYVDECVFEAR